MRIGVDLAAAVNQRAGIGRYARGVLGALAPLTSLDAVIGVSPRPNRYADAPDLPAGGALRDVERWVDTDPSGLLVPTLPGFSRGRVLALPLAERWLWVAWHRLHLPLPPDLLVPRLDVYYNPDFLLPRLAYASGVPTIHDLGFMTVPETSFPKLRDHLLWAVPWSLARARVVMAVSEHTKHDLVRLLGVPPERIHVAGNAVDSIFRPILDAGWRTQARTRLDLPERFLLAVGTLEPRKNLVRLLEALSILRDRGRAVPLVVAGREGWLFEPIYAAVERLHLGAQVRFVHGPTDQDLLALYNLATVMVYPSLYEGFGLPPLEALACGSVVVCSNTSSLPEVVGDAALLADPYDVDALAGALDQALDDDTLRQTLARRGPARARQYTWEASARRVLGALHEAARA